MKRLALAGTFTLLAGAFSLLLLASILYSCRDGRNPHQPGSSTALHAPHSQKTHVPRHRARTAKTKGSSPRTVGLILSSESRL